MNKKNIAFSAAVGFATYLFNRLIMVLDKNHIGYTAHMWKFEAIQFGRYNYPMLIVIFIIHFLLSTLSGYFVYSKTKSKNMATISGAVFGFLITMATTGYSLVGYILFATAFTALLSRYGYIIIPILKEDVNKIKNRINEHK